MHINLQNHDIHTEGKVVLADVQRLIKLHGDISSLTLMRALSISYATALDALMQLFSACDIYRHEVYSRG